MGLWEFGFWHIPDFSPENWPLLTQAILLMEQRQLVWLPGTEQIILTKGLNPKFFLLILFQPTGIGLLTVKIKV